MLVLSRYAAAVFGDKVLKGLNGEKTFEYSYVQSQLTEVPFFASKVGCDLGPTWVDLGPDPETSVRGFGNFLVLFREISFRFVSFAKFRSGAISLPGQAKVFRGQERTPTGGRGHDGDHNQARDPNHDCYICAAVVVE